MQSSYDVAEEFVAAGILNCSAEMLAALKTYAVPVPPQLSFTICPKESWPFGDAEDVPSGGPLIEQSVAVQRPFHIGSMFWTQNWKKVPVRLRVSHAKPVAPTEVASHTSFVSGGVPVSPVL